VPEILSLSYGLKNLIKNYINKWENNEEQRNMMINYKIDNIDDIINF
tara:strand:+ start:136 stop:276 length:141 start_codon:yes stop_codon:yes gene_type:complete